MGAAENYVEGYLAERVEAHGGLCDKHTCPGRRGQPDRIVTRPGGKKDWIETKAKNGRLSVLQKLDHERRRAIGDEVFVLWTREMVDDYVAGWMR